MAKHISAILALAVFVAASSPAAAQQTNRAQAGMLRCQTSASLGLIVGSHQKLRCTFQPGAGGPSQTYTGHINRLGLDLGVTAGGVMAWAVFAPSTSVPHNSLAGKYVGASGDLSLGVGVGANALIGGSHKTIALQPLSVEGQVGINLALGVAGMTLR